MNAKTAVLFLLTLIIAEAVGSDCFGPTAPAEHGGGRIASGFRHPPESCAVQTWWHWIDNCVTREGIARDLKAMADAGIGVAHIFAPRMTALPSSAKTMSPEWLDLFAFAIAEAKKNGVKLGFHNCPGWSSSGGPWIPPEDSMKCLVSSVRDIGADELKGASAVSLPRPPSKLGFYHDVRLYAFPVSAPPPLAAGGAPKTIPLAKNDTFEWECEYAGAFAPSVAVVDIGKTGFCMKAEVFAHVGGKWERRGAKDFVLYNAVDVPRVIPLADGESARRWKFLFTTLPDPGWIRRSDLPVRSLSFGNWPFSEGREAVAAEDVLDLGNVVRDDMANASALSELVRRGASSAWRILRVGYTTTGTKPGPSTIGGLECDKLDRRGLARHWSAMPARILSLPGAKDVVKHVIIDSYEVGEQTWTESLPGEFARIKGREVWRAIPAVLGYRIASDAATAKMKEDFKGVVGELYARNYYDYFAELCREAGVESMTEAYGGPFDSVRCWSEVDVPMCEFWLRRKKGGFIHAHSSVRKAVEAARTHGKNIIGAEAFSAEAPEGRWQATPEHLRMAGDEAWMLGVNMFVYHSYLHQPYLDRVPGTSLHRYGTQLNVNTTWWPQMRVWTDYVRRGQFLLQYGKISRDRFDVVPGKVEALVREGGGGERIWFLRNKSEARVVETLALDCATDLPVCEFDAVHGNIVEACRSDGGVVVGLEPGETTFYVFAAGLRGVPRVAAGDELADLSHGWNIAAFSGTAAPTGPIPADPLFDWSKSDDERLRHFSGAATYVRNGEFPAGILDLGEVRDVAEVRVDGNFVGTLAYHPYRISVPFGSKIEVKVVNTWPNRLIGDAQRRKRGEKPYTWSNWTDGWKADDNLLPAGLLGPVRLLGVSNENRSGCSAKPMQQCPTCSHSVQTPFGFCAL